MSQHSKHTGHLRVATYLAKFAASLDFEPALITTKRLGNNRHLVVSGLRRVSLPAIWGT